MMNWYRERWNEILRWMHIFATFKGVRGGAEYIYYYRKMLANNPKNAGRLLTLNYCGKELKVRVFSTDLFLVETILIGRKNKKGWVGEYHQVEELLEQRSEHPLVIVDAGANIGLFSLLLAAKHPEAKIIAIEPEQENFKLLSYNVQNYPNVICLNKGLWSKTCKLEVIPRGTGSWGFKVEETTQITDNVINAIGILDIVKKYELTQIDLLKMDIEGSENEVFKAPRLEWLHLCKAIVIETHDDIVEGTDELVNKTLKRSGFSKKMADENQLFYRE